MSRRALRHLYVVLDEASRRYAASQAVLPVVKADHVTLAHAAAEGSTVADYLEGSWREGDELTLQVVAEYCSDQVQAWLVELGGSSRRPSDEGLLHVTVSRSHDARSSDANLLLRDGTARPRSVKLRGTLAWVLAKSEGALDDLS